MPEIPASIPQKTQRLDSVDIAKFILSIMIVCVHIRPFGKYSYLIEPLLRMAVPLFFMISAYFFFKKQARIPSFEEKIRHLEKFVKRNLQLYGFWFVALFIPTLLYRDWFADGLLYGLFKIVNKFMFHSTFIASWYIMASIIATVAIVVLSRYLGNKSLLALFTPLYIVSCLMSNYYYAPAVLNHIDALNFAFSDPYNSFWVALFWVQAGKMIADNEARLRAIKTEGLLGIAAFGFLLLGCEQAYVLSNDFSAAQDCFFMLPLVCFPILLLILRVEATCRHTKFLRAASTITYCLHDTLNVTLTILIGLSLSAPIVFAIALVASWLLTIAVLKTEDRRGLRWLKYAH